MHKVMKKLVATLLAAVTIAGPATALAESSGYCSSYDQVHSDATGGDFVGGRLMYETEASVTRGSSALTTSSTTNINVGIPGTGTGVNVTTTSAQPGTTTTTQEPVGFYSMNDGSVWMINCVTGEERKIG